MDVIDPSREPEEINRRLPTPEDMKFLRGIGASRDLVDFVDREVRASTTIRRRRRRLTSLLLRRRRR